jgi:hypothetical protein
VVALGQCLRKRRMFISVKVDSGYGFISMCV